MQAQNLRIDQSARSHQKAKELNHDVAVRNAKLFHEGNTRPARLNLERWSCALEARRAQHCDSRASAARASFPIPVNAAPRLPLQCKLAVGAVNHPLEAEADAMAAQVVSGAPVASHAASASAPALHRQASGTAVPSVGAPASVHQALHSPGEPLDSATRSSLEPRFGSDLSRVRIHTGAQAAQSAADVQANAYTVGQHVFFAAGSYNPHSADGKRLLAHELSHTVQQSGGASGHAARLSSAAPAVQRDPTPQAAPGSTADDKKKQTKPEAVTLPLPSDFMNRFRLTPPSLLTPPQQPSIFSPGQYALGPQTPGASSAGAAPVPNLYPPSIFPTPTTSPAGSTQPGPTALPASPAGPSTTPAAAPTGAVAGLSLQRRKLQYRSSFRLSRSLQGRRRRPRRASLRAPGIDQTNRDHQLPTQRSDSLGLQRRSRQADRCLLGDIHHPRSRRSGQDCLRAGQQAWQRRPFVSIGCNDTVQYGQRLRPRCQQDRRRCGSNIHGGVLEHFRFTY